MGVIACAVKVRWAMLNEEGLTWSSTREPGFRFDRFTFPDTDTCHSPAVFRARSSKPFGVLPVNCKPLTSTTLSFSSTDEMTAVKRMREVTLARARTSWVFAVLVVRLRIDVATMAVTMRMTLPKKYGKLLAVGFFFTPSLFHARYRLSSLLGTKSKASELIQ